MSKINKHKKRVFQLKEAGEELSYGGLYDYCEFNSSIVLVVKRDGRGKMPTTVVSGIDTDKLLRGYRARKRCAMHDRPNTGQRVWQIKAGLNYGRY